MAINSSKTIKQIFPDSMVMMCGGHAGRSHLKQLQTWSKRKRFSKTLQKQHKKKYPEVERSRCHCKERHFPGCGCLSDAFIKQSRNNFSLILSRSQTAAEFAQRLRNLYHHALYEHGECDFHSETVCSCGKCEDKNAPQLAGKQYHTCNKLTCPFHQLAYKIEIERRAGMADSLVHPELKRGHSNWLEASHNVLIRFRSNHIALERLHYHLSTDLGLLQANLTYMQNKEGSDYHWIPELYQRMKLPLSGGVVEALMRFEEKRHENQGDKGREEQKEENTTQSETYTGTGREKAVEQATQR